VAKINQRRTTREIKNQKASKTDRKEGFGLDKTV